jgi:hypothetical protein
MTVTPDPQIVAFTTIAGLLTLTPGADTMLVMRNVMARGRGAGLCTSLGSCCGVCLEFPAMKAAQILSGRHEHDAELLAGQFRLRVQRLGARPAGRHLRMHHHAKTAGEQGHSDES